MIIGKNTNIQPKNNFTNNNPSINNQPNNNYINDLSQTAQHKNIMDKQEMQDRSFQMLQERLNKGLISLDEFNKICSKMGKTK
ncbi:MAG: hypothetical protein IKF71_05395 [Bacilli bacterium]|nr:hypothetical protein [Bacilli bacterium]